MENKHYYRALTRNMVLIVILVSFTPLLLTTLIIGYQFETSYREKVAAHLIELVQKHQQNINIFLNEKLAYVRVLSDSFPLEQLRDEAFLANKLKVLQHAYGGVFVDIGLVNDQGVQIAYAGAFKLENANYSDADWFRKAIGRPFYISDVFLGLRRQQHFIVSAKHAWDGRDWLLRATIDFEAFNSLVESVHVGKTGSAFIVNREGDFQTKPRLEPVLDKDFFLKAVSGGSLDKEVREINVASVLKKALDLHPGDSVDAHVTMGSASFSGKEVLYVMTPLKSGEWILAYQQDERDAFADLYHARVLVVTIFFIGGLGIITMAIFLSKRMVKHIERADREKEMMNEQVIEAGKLASVGELAAGIAHEINNPIAIMVEEAGWIGDLLDEEDLKQSENLDEFKRALTQIRTQGERCKEITHKLLSFARRTDPRVREVRINELIEEVVDISEQRSRYSNVKISMELGSELPPISASPSEIQQVFLNLINNAIDAIGPSGGSITIASRLGDGSVVVDVADSGHGIPKAILARIFDPFFTTKPVGKGTGLGLSICYGIIKKMGGEITVNSAVGLGTTFHIYFPVERKAEEQ